MEGRRYKDSRPSGEHDLRGRYTAAATAMPLATPRMPRQPGGQFLARGCIKWHAVVGDGGVETGWWVQSRQAQGAASGLDSPTRSVVGQDPCGVGGGGALVHILTVLLPCSLSHTPIHTPPVRAARPRCRTCHRHTPARVMSTMVQRRGGTRSSVQNDWAPLSITASVCIHDE